MTGSRSGNDITMDFDPNACSLLFCCINRCKWSRSELELWQLPVNRRGFFEALRGGIPSADTPTRTSACHPARHGARYVRCYVIHYSSNRFGQKLHTLKTKKKTKNCGLKQCVSFIHFFQKRQQKPLIFVKNLLNSIFLSTFIPPPS